MGVDAADFDSDGDLDLVVSNLTGETHTLFRNEGRGVFRDATVEVGLAEPSVEVTGFGAAFLDADNDGALDLLVVNGAVRKLEALVRAGDPYPLRQRNQIFRNLGRSLHRREPDRRRRRSREPRSGAARCSATSTTTATPTSW